MYPKVRDYPKDWIIKDTVYSLKFVKKIPKETKEIYGLCDPSEHIIYIKKCLGKEESFKTLCHELFHCFEYEYDLEIPHTLIYKLEKPIADLIMQNVFYLSLVDKDRPKSCDIKALDYVFIFSIAILVIGILIKGFYL